MTFGDGVGPVSGWLELNLATKPYTCLKIVLDTPGLVVNKARRATKSDEAKPDPRDAQTIADQLRLRGGCWHGSPPATRPRWICAC
ncbi:hypothetical protein [Saccharopolyspora spinosa]|uniref:hypothetical protein n=1 Tax=Saccharopolyspora spinosa TaxID=60894 RepID=UPI00374806DB